MIVEHALLRVKPGRAAEFESAFGQAESFIASVPGFRKLTLSRSVERQETYLLLVEWDALEDHAEDLRGSDEYQQWLRLLKDFYQPFPAVEHYEQVQTAHAAQLDGGGMVELSVVATTSVLSRPPDDPPTRSPVRPQGRWSRSTSAAWRSVRTGLRFR